MQSASLIGRVLDEKYRIEKQLGQGGMGSVYLATHLGTDRPVALKVIAPQFMAEDEFVARFRREAKAAGRMHHPNVVDVTDFGFGQVDGRRVAYLVMEYLEGCSLGDVLAEESMLPIAWVVDILEQTCSAVDEAHQHGTIHRDLKPDNIWLEPNRRSGYTVKVLDFGLAKLGEAALPDSALPDSVEQPASATDEPDRPTQDFDSRPALERPFVPPIKQSKNSLSQSGASVRPASSEEATTLVQQAPVEAKTLVLTENRSESTQAEAETQLLPPPAANPANNSAHIQADTLEQRRAAKTAPIVGLTHVGSILGTPLYMSPEQCRGEKLDSRSDIYSLGVITYHMLAGEPPFRGEPQELLQLHIEASPAPVRNKRSKVPKRMAALVMSALEKDPSRRPSTAAGFSSALRASAEGSGVLLRRAFALYSEHFPLFFRVSLLAFLPMLALRLIELAITVLEKQAIVPRLAGRITIGSLEVIAAILSFLASSIVVGITIRLVTQLFVAPLRPLQLGPAYSAVKKRLRSLIFVSLSVIILSAVGLVLLVVPGVIFYINSSLTVPVVMMEGLKGRAAIRRSKQLVKRSRLTVIAILLIQYAIPLVVQSMVALVITAVRVLSPGTKEIVGQIIAIATGMFNVLIVPLIAILAALLYLKTRQLGGETLREALSQFEQEEMPTSKWQRRMRDRLHLSTPTSR